MYDYEKNDEQLSKGNNVGTFHGKENISSDFKLNRESLPHWAVNWAKDKLNMDAQNVKFYVMDKEDSDGPFAAASGDSIFVTSSCKNDETVIKHELTHIYQQAVGTATENNVEDTSLEEEAVQTSKESKVSPIKSQTQRDGYILPKEKTNIIQPFFGAFGLAMVGLIVGGITAVGAAVGSLVAAGVGIYRWHKRRQYKKIISARTAKFTEIANRIKVPLETVEMVYNTYSWADVDDKYCDILEDLCRVVNDNKVSESVLRECSSKTKRRIDATNKSETYSAIKADVIRLDKSKSLNKLNEPSGSDKSYYKLVGIRGVVNPNSFTGKVIGLANLLNISQGTPQWMWLNTLVGTSVNDIKHGSVSPVGDLVVENLLKVEELAKEVIKLDKYSNLKSSGDWDLDSMLEFFRDINKLYSEKDNGNSKH